MTAERVHADDTTVPVLDPGRGRTNTGRLWCYVRDDRPFARKANPAVLYCYSPDRKGEHPHAHLAPFRGILQADGYAGYAPLYDRSVTEARVGLMYGGNSSMCMQRRARPWRRKPCNASPRCTPSKPRSAANRPRPG